MYCSYCHKTNQSISACFKNNEMEKIDVMLMHDQKLRKNVSSIISIFLPMIKHQGMTQDQMTTQIDTVVEENLVITILNIDQDLHLELVIIMIDILLPHTTLDHVMKITKEILAHTLYHKGLLIDHPTTVIHVPGIK